jgi:hypothetical protein
MKVKTITCPNCGHANNFLAEDCSQCGINFSKYYEELEKAEALRRHIEEQEKAEALRKQQAEEARQAKERKRQQEEEARAEEERRRKKEEKKAEALRKQQEEEARQEVERRKEAQKRADILKRQKEELEKAEEERRRKEEKEKAEALRKLQEEENRQAEAEAESDSESAAPLQMPVNTPDFRSADTLQDRLFPYVGQMIGVTYGNPSDIQNVKLIAANEDHFQIFYPISKNVVSYPYQYLAQVTENPEGISAVGPDISPVFPVVVEVPRPFFHKS